MNTELVPTAPKYSFSKLPWWHTCVWNQFQASATVLRSNAELTEHRIFSKLFIPFAYLQYLIILKVIIHLPPRWGEISACFINNVVLVDRALYKLGLHYFCDNQSLAGSNEAVGWSVAAQVQLDWNQGQEFSGSRSLVVVISLCNGSILDGTELSGKHRASLK